MLSRRLEFLAPTRELHELRILGQIAEGEAGSLRSLASRSMLGRTMVHKYVSEMHCNGWIEIESRSNRDYQYRITDRGSDRLDELVLRASLEVAQLYALVKSEFRHRLIAHARAGSHRTVLFGAAETAELVHAVAEGTGIEIVGVVDNDVREQGRSFGSLRVESPERLLDPQPDTVLITSSGHGPMMIEQMRHVEAQGVRVVRV